MNERHLIEIIKDIVGDKYIGDDCAYLEDLGVVISQDSLVQDVHFSMDWMSARELGIKSALVNISDVLASGAKPCYMTVSLSLPPFLKEEFVRDFYDGLSVACKKYGVKVIGGDLTGSDKVYVSISVIGRADGRNISSRKNAQVGYNVYVAGVHGESAVGLKALLDGDETLPQRFIDAHKSPKLCRNFAYEVANIVREPYAMMDTSDGLADALFKIAKASGVTISIDLMTVPTSEQLKKIPDYKNLLMFGGEDYGLVAVVPDKYIINSGVKIGEVLVEQSSVLNVADNGKIVKYSSIDEFTYQHFKVKP